MSRGPGLTAWTNQDVGITAPEPGAIFEMSLAASVQKAVEATVRTHRTG